MYFFEVQYIFFCEFEKEGLFGKIHSNWLYINFQLQITLFFTSIRCIFSALFLFGTFTLTLYAILFIQRRQMWVLVMEIKRQKNKYILGLTGSRLQKFYSLSNAYLRLLADANKLYGPAILRFFLVAYPENAHLLMFLLFQKSGSEGQSERSGSLTVGLIFLIGQQLFVMFAVHVFSARMAHDFHRPVKPLRTVFLAGNGSRVNFNDRIKLAAYLQALNVSNRYGLRYGKVGAITYASFGKSLIFYLKLLIYSYRLFNLDSS